MKLHSIFAKPVDRPIEGVIKADDDSSLWTEVDEYVLTNEVEQRLEGFLDAYNNYAGANGVWISGFFGCGKSHLLKMLALLLENREVEGRAVVDSFAGKCGDNIMLKGALQKAVAIPSESILFNIDQKADVISRNQDDALLAVFVKVFDESCGYYGKQGYIAHFERKLDEDGLLDDFRRAFEELQPNGWQWGRTRVDRMAANIDKAYEQATGQAVAGIMDRTKADYKLSIEDFADLVGRYIDKQPDKKFRLNFFVDEVGQYIADNTKLMTNLQTIAESLATRCKGRAWVIVTAQEDMNTIIGEMGKQQGNDFSKIQDRFSNALKLTSQNVAEVIQKRLLQKTAEGETEIGAIYEREQNNFKTLFDFTDGQKYRNFQSHDHFVGCYPFIPYQFELFQLAIRNLSKQNAFEGRHSSVGERSMLGVFQEVAKHISEQTVGELATFDLMFEGISTALKGQIQSSILVAKRNLENPLAIRLLKALFLVKYVREFRPTLDNLCILMFNRFECDVPELRKQLESALNQLEHQVYIQRNGELYEFLTDEEKDISQEIKNTEIDHKDIADELGKIVFEQVLKSHKLRYEATKHDYPFTRKLDDRIFGRENELSIHIISPFHDEYDRLDSLRMQAMGRLELLVVLPPNDRLIRDLTLYKQTGKYVSQNVSVTQQESIKRILSDKTHANKGRHADIVESLSQLLGEAQMFVANAEVESSSHDPNLRIHDGFEALIVQTYTNLTLLRGINYSEEDIEKCASGGGDDLFGATDLSEAEAEMLSFISRNSQKGIMTHVKAVVEHFERRPNGWPLTAVLCVLAKLCGRGKLEASSDSEPLESKGLVIALKNTRRHANVILEPQIEFTPSQIRRLKDFIQDFFDNPAGAADAKSLGAECATHFEKLHAELDGLYSQRHTYPFVAVLADPLEQFKQLADKPFKYFFTEFEATAEDLHELKEDALDPLRSFMVGPSGKLYAEAATFLADQQSNLANITDPVIQKIELILNDPRVYATGRMQDVKGLLKQLKAIVAKKVAEAHAEAERRIEVLRKWVVETDLFGGLPEETQAEINAAFDRIADKAKAQLLVANIRHTVQHFEETVYPTLLRQVEKRPDPGTDKPGTGKTGPGPTTDVKQKYVPLRKIHVAFDKPYLGEEDDVDRYLEALKTAAMKEIDQGKRVQL